MTGDGVDAPAAGGERRHVALVAIATALLFVTVTWPVVLTPAQAIASSQGDGFFDMLMFWYARSGDLWLPRVGGLFYPQGARLGAEQGYWLVPAMSVPLQSLLPLPVVYNLLTAAFYVATGVAAYLLARETGADRWGSTLACLLLVLYPAYVNELATGIPENMQLQWPLLYLWCGLRLRGEAPPRWVAPMAGVFLALSWLGSWYLGAFALVYSLVLPWRRMAVSLAVAAVLLALPLWHVVSAGRAAAAVYSPAVASAALQHKMLPGPPTPVSRSRWLHRPDTMGTLQVIFSSVDPSGLLRQQREGRIIESLPNLFMLTLAALGLLAAPRRAWPWAALAGLLGFLSLGPWLIWNGEGITVLPTEWFYAHVPMLARLRPTRFVLAAGIPLAIMAAHGFPRLERRRWAAPVLLAVMVSLHAVDVFVVQVPHSRIHIASTHVPAFYRRLAAAPPTEALIEVPVMPYRLQEGQQLYYQTVHRHPMLNYNFLTQSSIDELAAMADGNGLLNCLLEGDTAIRRRDPAALAELGFTRLVLHTRAENVQRDPAPACTFDARLFARLAAVYGEPTDEGDGILAFDMRRIRADVWAADGTLEPTAVGDTLPPLRAQADEIVLPVPQGAASPELRMWICGDVPSLVVTQTGKEVAQLRHEGSQWDWVRVPLSVEPGLIHVTFTPGLLGQVLGPVLWMPRAAAR